MDILKKIREMDTNFEKRCYTYKEKQKIRTTCPRCKAVVTIHNFYTHTRSKRCSKPKSNSS